MKTATRKPFRLASYASVPKTYRQLCALYLPRPIHDAREDAAATEMMNALAVFENLNRDQQDYLDTLTEFVDAYDREQTQGQPWPEVSGLDVLRHLMAEHQMTAADLSRVLGASRNLGAMILRGERGLSKANIRKLTGHFHVSPEVFL